MEVKLEKRYPLDVDAARAWAVLRNVKATAECMPGAAITEQVDPTHYKGNVKVKVGPANAAFNGTIEVLALDEASRTLQLLGKGADRTGSSASMKLTAAIVPGDSTGSSVLTGDAEVNVTGKFAQFGGRMMVQVADLLLEQFADNFRAAAAALPDQIVESSSSREAPAGDGAAVAAAIDAGADAGAAIAAGQAAQPAVHASARASSDDTFLVDDMLGRVPEATSAVAPDPRAPGPDSAAGANAGLRAPAHATTSTPPSALASAANPTPATDRLHSAAPPPQPQHTPSPAPALAGRTLPPQRRTEINGVSLAWALIKGWFRRLFDRG